MEVTLLISVAEAAAVAVVHGETTVETGAATERTLETAGTEMNEAGKGIEISETFGIERGTTSVADDCLHKVEAGRLRQAEISVTAIASHHLVWMLIVPDVDPVMAPCPPALLLPILNLRRSHIEAVSLVEAEAGVVVVEAQIGTEVVVGAVTMMTGTVDIREPARKRDLGAVMIGTTVTIGTTTRIHGRETREMIAISEIGILGPRAIATHCRTKGRLQ